MTALVLATLSPLSGGVSAYALTTSPAAATPATSASATAPNTKKAAVPARATFGIGPITLGKTNNRGYFSYQMGVGSNYSDKVVVLNYGAVALNLSVFAVDLLNGDGGSITAGLQNAPTTDAGGWVKLPAKNQTVTVKAATKKAPGSVVLPFTISVPSNAIPGDHAAAIVASLSTLGKNSKGVDTRFDQRIATRMYLRVAGPLRPALAIEDLQVSYQGTANPVGKGKAEVSYTVHNTGNVRLAASQLVRVSGLFGTRATPVTPPGVQLLLPRSSLHVSVEVPGVLPTIWQKARVTVTPQLFQDQRPMAVPTDTKTASFYAIPWSLFAIIALVLVLLVFTWFLRRRHRRRPSPPPGSKHSRGNGPAPTPAPVRPEVEANR